MRVPINPDQMAVDVSRFADNLRSHGFEVEDQPSGYRVLMWRKEESAWTHAHFGMDKGTNKVRDFLTVSGPDSSAINLPRSLSRSFPLRKRLPKFVRFSST
jgi:hypothetical protein